MKGFKAFESDWTCRGFQYEVGKTFTEDVIPVCCKRGFHFCTKAIDCFKHYDFSLDCKVAEVEALGEVATSGSKCCTNKIRIVREVTWHELLDMVNTGEGCTGHGNSGDYNSGDYNSGNCNSGGCNSGDCNSGSYNSGDYNSGDWNDTNYSNGCFNTREPKIYMFNKPTDLTYLDWRNSCAFSLMNKLQRDAAWIPLTDMTNQEKKAHPEAETTGGYLKKLNNQKEAVKWWRSLKQDQKKVIMEMPNFDKEIFKQITGVDVDAD